VAVIAGAGGGYLAVNKKSPPPTQKASPQPSAETTQVWPAYPFPGQGGGALPALPLSLPQVPEFPYDQPASPVGEPPIVTSLRPTYSNFIEDQNLTMLQIGTERAWMDLSGKNFTRTNNVIKWDGNIIGRFFSSLSGTKLTFQTPANQQLCSTHDISVTTLNGTSNSVKIKLVEPWQSPLLWTRVYPESGPIGTEVDFEVFPAAGSDILDILEKYYSSEFYAVFFLPAKYKGVGAAPLTVITPPSSANNYKGVYRLKIPAEVHKCLPAVHSVCSTTQVVPLGPESYGVYVIGVYTPKYCGGSKITDSPWGQWDNFTVTEK